MSPADIIILICIAALVALTVKKLFFSKNKGCCGSCSQCGGQCPGCEKDRKANEFLE